MSFLRSPAVTVLAQSAVAVPHTGTTDETTVATITIPAGAMGATGQVEVVALWSYPNSANSKTLKTKFGGTTFTNSAPTTTQSNQLYTRVANRGATNSQVGAAVGSTGFGSVNAAAITAAIDTTAAVDVTLTAQLASAAETVTLESYSVRLIR